MPGPNVERRLWIGLGLLTGAALCLVAVGVALIAYRLYQAADYPGAQRVSDHRIYSLVPLHVRRDTSYRTSDPFPIVYNWYSGTFQLGPEARAQSACILMVQSRTAWLVVENVTAVTLCDTPSGRMMFVQRSFSIQVRQ